MKHYYSYTRVSTAKQGQNGTSLTEQREAIRRYAERTNIKITHEYEEQETAAKRGRSVFTEMIKALKAGQAAGVVMHKIDRSARNLRDWAEIGELIDTGVEFHFVNENIDLHSRGGRLSADIQAVVAADYIRNLREEVKKGMYGRLKQGLLPLPAPLGYLNCGKGKRKEIDPERGPLIRHAFELYSSGNLGLRSLADRMHDLGLRTRSGRKVFKTGWAGILRNPFYAGVIRLKKTGETYVGQHDAVISRVLFDRVQKIMDGKLTGDKRSHDHLFRRVLRCSECQSLLYGELQKRRVYYRCHNKACQQKTIREDTLEETVAKLFRQLSFSEEEKSHIRKALSERWNAAGMKRERDLRLFNLQLENVRQRLSTLGDAYIDGTFDKETYLEKKNSYVVEQRDVQEKIEKTKRGEDTVLREVERVLELANDAYSCWKDAEQDEKRELIETIFSNLEVKGKTLILKLKSPFAMVSTSRTVPFGAPSQDMGRTISLLVSQLRDYFIENGMAV